MVLVIPPVLWLTTLKWVVFIVQVEEEHVINYLRNVQMVCQGYIQHVDHQTTSLQVKSCKKKDTCITYTGAHILKSWTETEFNNNKRVYFWMRVEKCYHIQEWSTHLLQSICQDVFPRSIFNCLTSHIDPCECDSYVCSLQRSQPVWGRPEAPQLICVHPTIASRRR